MTDRELMGMALEAFKLINDERPFTVARVLIRSLRDRLAQPEREPQRQWQGLTNEEIGALAVFDGLHHVDVPVLVEFIRAIEAAIKEKNT